MDREHKNWIKRGSIQVAITIANKGKRLGNQELHRICTTLCRVFLKREEAGKKKTPLSLCDKDRIG